MMQQPAFGQRLRELRMARGLSQTALANAQLSTSYISRLESGDRPPTPQVVAYLAERLGVPTSELGDTRDGEFADVIARGLNSLNEFDSTITREILLVQSSHDATIQWQLLLALANAQERAGDVARQRESLDALLALGDATGAPSLRIRARVELSRFTRGAGDLDAAARSASEAIEIARAEDATATDTARAMLVGIAVEAELGRLDEARGLADGVIDVVGGTANVSPTLVAEARWSAAMVHLRQGLADEAAGLIELAISGLDSHDDLLLWMRLRMAAASLYLQMKPRRLDAAKVRIREVEPIVSLIASPRQVQEYQSLLAHVAFHEGRFEDAQTMTDELRQGPALLSFRDQVRTDILRFRIQLARGRTEVALADLSALATRLQSSDSAELAAEAWSALAEAMPLAAP